MFRKIVLWFGGILLFSFVGYLITSIYLSPRNRTREDFARRVMNFQFSEAIRAYETGGVDELRQFLASMDEQFPVRHYLLDQNGKDLITGEDRSATIDRAGSRRPRLPFRMPGQFLIRSTSPDGRYIYLLEGESRAEPLANLVIYGWIVAVIVLLCYALAWTLAKPVRQLRETVVRFGSGDLASRTYSKRRDELGDLSRAFDQMADRIQTLLTAERRLLQDISHELRSPLARLRFATELARNNRSEAAFNRVNKEIERLSTLVGELLQVTRAEGDPESRNVSSIQLSEFLESIVNDARIEAEARGIQVDLLIHDRLSWSGDRELLHRAVENILRNAIAHSPDNSSVEVDLKTIDDQIVCRIRDYGPGVPEEQLSNIFRPFYRVEEDRARDSGGVGLGLAIAERAVRVHHGEIKAFNMYPGLLVELRLPQQEVPHPSVQLS